MGFAPKLRPNFARGSRNNSVSLEGQLTMPYKDPESKNEWERQHRTQRLTRRRELRRFHATNEATQNNALQLGNPIGLLWLPLAAGAGLAAYNPVLAIGAGGLTLLVATFYKKDWGWWFVGLLTIGLSILFLWTDLNEKR